MYKYMKEEEEEEKKRDGTLYGQHGEYKHNIITKENMQLAQNSSSTRGGSITCTVRKRLKT